MDFASNGFVLICAALVFIMTPGLAFFYGGLARKKNVIDTMMASVGIMGFSILLWCLITHYHSQTVAALTELSVDSTTSSLWD